MVATHGIIRAMRALRAARIVAELIVVTAAWWVVMVVGFVLAVVTLSWAHDRWLNKPMVNADAPELLVVIPVLLLWLAFRRVTQTVDWIERRFWEARAG